MTPQEAIIDIDDDYLDRGSTTGPTFTIWTGRDYTFVGSSASTAAPPFNTQFEVEVANDDAFTLNLVSSGTLGGVVAADGGTATFTLAAADWNTLKAGDFLYYRVTTTDAAGGTSRSSLDPRPGVLTTVPPPRAVVNESGICVCGGPIATVWPPFGIFLAFLPLTVALIWRRTIRSRRT